MKHDIKRLAIIFKALSSEQRLTIFIMLYEMGIERSSYNVCCNPIQKAFTTISDCLKISRSTVSHHFKELQNAGLITCTRQGKCFDCKINIEILDEIRNFLK